MCALKILGHWLGVTAASVAVMFLLVFSFAAVLPVARASTPVNPGQARLPASQSLFNPQYIILGQLQGSTLVQSQHPHSVSLVGGVQFAATWYTAQDLENAYGVNSLFPSGNGGRGETIAIIDAYGDPEVSQDLATYSKLFNLPSPSLSIIPVGPYAPELGISTGWDVETALDVEVAHAMAPYAHINLLVAANASNALFEAIKMVVEDHLGDAVSMSWGGPESLIMQSGFVELGSLGASYAEYYFSLGASQGISFFSASGDTSAFGGTTTAHGGVNFPATSPFVTAVGGTTLFLTPTSGSFADLNSSSQYEGETAWSVDPLYQGAQVGSGGGVSTIFPQPYYQAGAYTSGFRTEPDVSADANPYTGADIVLEGASTVIGGTSLASPLWAGMAADLDQYMGRSLGSLNPIIYSIYGNRTAYDESFNQVTSGYNVGYQAGPGYNLVTGMGSPKLLGLASAIKSQEQGLSIKVTTGQSSIGAEPQYYYGDTFSISARIATAQGSTVSSGSFTASLISTQGLANTVPLTFNGSQWVGSYTVGATDPPNIWTVEVSGSSGGVSGYGITDIDVGGSMLILAPIPYPFGPPEALNESFFVYMSASLPNGSLLSNLNLTAYFNYGGKTVYSTPLLPVGGGIYAAKPKLAIGDPQGTYFMVINASSFGSVYDYLYVGEAVIGTMVTPVNGPSPSASEGQVVTFLAETVTNESTGLFTSNVTANIYDLKGNLVATVPMQPAPNTAQYGLFNFFKNSEGNFTIPAYLTPGFYRVEFVSQYYQNTTLGIAMGNFTTGFYVSGSTLQYTVSHPSVVFQGQYVELTASILDSTGVPITQGVFFGTAIPTGYTFEAEVTDFSGITGVPMQYNSTLGEWQGQIQIPSALTSLGISNLPGVLSGPWTVFVGGSSMSAENVVPVSSYVNVLPYTYVSYESLTPSSVQGAALVSTNGTGYLLYNAASNSLSISGLTITLGDDYFGSLTITNSTVRLAGTRVTSVTAADSKLVLAENTAVGLLSLTSTTLTIRDSSYVQLSPATPTISVTGLSQPVSTSATYTVTVNGQQLVPSSLAVEIDGAPATVATTSSPSGLTATGSVSAATLSDGVHTLTVTAYQQDGMSSTATVYFATDGMLAAAQNTISSLGSQISNQNATLQGQATTIKNQASTISSLSGKVSNNNNTITSLMYGLFALGIIAIVALGVAVVAVRRREATATPAQAPAPQA